MLGNMLAFILLCGVAAVSAQDPRPCVSPDQMEGRFFSVDFDKNFRQFAKFAYDETNRRIRETEELDFGNNKEYFDKLYLHRENMEYKVNLRTKTCNKTAISRPFIPFGVPPQARYDGEVNIGPVNIAAEHVTAANFEGRTPEGNDFFGSVSWPDCVPITVSFSSNDTGHFHRTFLNVVTGIADPNVFDVPRECQ